jgi:transcriptional regulator with XRE-family HTH domain
MDPTTNDIAHRIREEVARRRMSRQSLAALAKISMSTLEKAMAGSRPFTLATVIRIEEALGVRFRPVEDPAQAHHFAPDHMGAYSKAAVRWLEGRYLALRPSFSMAGSICGSLIEIHWNEDAGYLGFAETQRLDARFEQAGHVSLPNLSGHIYLVTNVFGQYRMMILNRPTIDGTLFGTLSTLKVGHGSQLIPTCCATALVREEHQTDLALGLIHPGAPRHAAYSEILDTVTRSDYASFV